MLDNNDGLVAKIYKETMDAARTDGYESGKSDMLKNVKEIFSEGVNVIEANEMVFDDTSDKSGGNLYESKDNMVSHPEHYKSKNGIECIDCIEAVTENMHGIYATDTGNIIKYAFRWDKKGTRIQDVEKIIWYATHLLKKLKKENKKRKIKDALGYTE